MNKRLKVALITGGAIAAIGGGGAAIAAATGAADDGNGTPITGSALDKASKVALEQTGGGQVTATEIRDEEGYYEVEVKKTDGSEVDVHLDRHFNMIDSSADSGSGDSGSN
jgi:shikimate 5-dehydrogenase